MRATLLLAILAACGGGGGGGGGGGDDNPGGSDPVLVEGGGTTGDPIAGTLHVYAIDHDSGSPLSGAAVRVETATPLTGTTDATGLVTFTDAALTGAQTITATASGHAAVTWVGVPSVNATLPLQSSAPPATAHVKGSIDGLPTPNNTTTYTLAVVLYTFLDDPSSPENSIAQPTDSGQPKNTCVVTIISGNDCNWELTTRTGLQVHTAVIVKGDTHGTQNDISDDTYTLIGYASGSAMTLTAGQQVNGEALSMVSGTKSLQITVPSAIAGLPAISTIPELAIGAAGRVVFPLPAQATSGARTVLAPTGAFAGHYEVVAIATPSATAKAPYSTTFAHDVTDTATLPAWLPAPGAPSASGGTYTFTGASGASFHTAQFTRGTSVVWNVSLFDGATSFALPALSPDPLGTGSLSLSISGAEVPGWAADHFTIPNVTAKLARASGSQATVSH